MRVRSEGCGGRREALNRAAQVFRVGVKVSALPDLGLVDKAALSVSGLALR